MRLPESVTVVEVGLRDGLQAESIIVPTRQKVAWADALAASGLPLLELTSFVHPKAVPQMADAEALTAKIARRPGTQYGALVLNRRGAERALAAGVDEVRYAIMVSETFSLKNAQMTVGNALAQLVETVALCRSAPSAIPVVAVLGTCFGCPFEGMVTPATVLNVLAQCLEAGASRVTLCDTTGMANPAQVARLCADVQERWPGLPVSLHFHNTRGMGLANVIAGLEAGVTAFEASVGGLGGCPFAPRATGNICTEDLVHMLHAMGIATGVNLSELIKVALEVQEWFGRVLPGQVKEAGPCV